MNYLPKNVNGEPFLPNFYNATLDYEHASLPIGYTVYIKVDHKVIGYAIFRGGYWCGYCYVSDISYKAAKEFEKNLNDFEGENEGDRDDSFLNKIPEITFIARNQPIIGWDHAPPKDGYTNLAGVLAEIWSVWKLCGSY